VLADATETDAGIASAVNNAIARVAGLMGTAAVGAAIAAAFASNLDGRLENAHLGASAQSAVAAAKRLPLGRPSVEGLPPGQAHTLTSAAEAASVHSFHVGMMIAAVLLAIGGVIGVIGVRNVHGPVEAEDCSRGHIVGTGRELAERSECERAASGRPREPAAAGSASG
jgi:hypothetical protein